MTFPRLDHARILEKLIGSSEPSIATVSFYLDDSVTR